MGCYGAAAVTSRLLGLNEADTIQALNVVDSHNPMRRRGVPSGKSMRGVMTKEEIGWAVMAGITAAMLAREGFTGPYSVYDDARFDQSLSSGPGEEYEILKVYHKPHAACLLLHAALDCVLELRNNHSITADNVAAIDVASSPVSIMLDSKRPDSIEQAAYGMPWLIGCAILDGEIGPKQLHHSRLEEKAILDIADKVTLGVDPQVEALGVAGELGAAVKIKTNDGQTYETRLDRGRVLTRDEVVEKFRTLATGPLGKDNAEAVLSCVNNLESLKSTRELVKLIAKF
jgi:2-methylcitrate dehydratase PrpD